MKDRGNQNHSEHAPCGRFEYDLPTELIAQDPPPGRTDSLLLETRRGGGVVALHSFEALPRLLRPGDLLVVNDSRVLPARLWARKADRGARVELLLLQPAEQQPDVWRALARPARRLHPGTVLHVLSADDPNSTASQVELLECLADGEVLIRLSDGGDLADLASRHGDVPLPPYIRREPDAPDAARRRCRDRERYQTVYARTDTAGIGSVAAPTAGLHFDREMLERLGERGVAVARLTLHVGAGTFRQPTDDQVASGRLHAERFILPSTTWASVRDRRSRGSRVFAVGTTSLRVLETAHRLGLSDDALLGTRREFRRGKESVLPIFEGFAERGHDGWTVEGLTRLFIQPPDRVHAVDGLLTNFHLPGSSLLRLVAAFCGEDGWRKAYTEAVLRRLRFFSYGDAMLVVP